MSRALPALAAASALALTGCAGGVSEAGATAGDVTLTVFAAASLADAFEEIGERFEVEHPGVEVRFNVAGSSSLAQQIRAGAPADVFASADEPTMDRAVEADAVSGSPRPFATNVLALVTPPDNPAGIASLQDAAAEGVDLVVCAPQVPCGAATATLAADAGLALAPVSEESSVTDVLGKVTSGEADAGLVYATDAAAAGDAVHAVRLERAGSAVNTYPIAALAHSEHRELAEAFVEFVLGAPGRQVLRDDGFGAP
ncbi:MAG: molybdate ABC transporter substrate-binding protein [Micrococcus sp.]|nr:molybdate ABC transporter substrate-binding protein [Micrococcus sp.]